MFARTIGRTAIAAVFLLAPLYLFAAPATAPAIYTQPQHPAGTIYRSCWWDPDGSDYDQYLWDGFRLPMNATITEIHWRGAFDPSYFGYGGPVRDFSVEVWPSILNGYQPAIIGQPLVHYQTGGNANQTPAGSIGNTVFYDYSFVLPTPLRTSGGAKYWLQIEAYQWGIPDWALAGASSGDGKVFLRTAGVGDIRYVMVNGDSTFTLFGTLSQRARFDYDGDGKADLAVFRPADNYWYINNSSNGSMSAARFGVPSDYLMPGDFDGDGKADVAVWRENVDQSSAYCFILRSSDSTVRTEQFGQTWDVLAVGDWDGDGIDDPAVYRDSAFGQQSYFFYKGSLNNPNGAITFVPWGTAGDRPVSGDHDGDGKVDAAVYRPSDSIWYIRQSSDGQLRAENWGVATDKFVPADYDGDGRSDLAVYRGGTWYIRRSSDGGITYAQFGVGTDVPVPADYDGDGKADISVFRDGVWFMIRSSNGQFTAQQFGVARDRPVNSAYFQ